MTTAQSSDTLPSTIPKLDPSGVNWAVFSERFQDAVRAKRLWGHFDGTTIAPDGPADAANPTAAETLRIETWSNNEATARYLLTQKIPDSALMRV
ncbi:hypothetical protein NEOLEDRAFT_1056780 [Neolentinus lepideus HHB14362 ss-1]|uniref:Uncharacterized protein n=1 Tax=Neolentinus lepideus HHB14362 ss-1 TaxID=1314782 RepID=A0A165VEP0_9AGAM|nr:hypothetical protein NEOLEDRAFT_1056780 [Neolentinus lepideus HHB14362 ss-1]